MQHYSTEWELKQTQELSAVDEEIKRLQSKRAAIVAGNGDSSTSTPNPNHLQPICANLCINFIFSSTSTLDNAGVYNTVSTTVVWMTRYTSNGKHLHADGISSANLSGPIVGSTTARRWFSQFGKALRCSRIESKSFDPKPDPDPEKNVIKRLMPSGKGDSLSTASR